jgi:hypothetical protein
MTDSATTPPGRKGRPRGRSPAYPGIDLETALKRAETLYQAERTNPAHMDTILRHWGYTPKAGPGRTAFSALNKYGLLLEEGSSSTRRGRLSELALQIIRDDRPDSVERLQRIQKAALLPPIHKEIWSRYRGTLPSDQNLRYTLIQDRSFTETGANEFIQEFRATIAFARLTGTTNMPPVDEGKGDNGGIQFAEDPMNPPTDAITPPPAGFQPPGAQAPVLKMYRLPLMRDEAILQLPSPMTEAAWRQMLAILEAMKPGIVAEDDASK